MGTQLTHEEIRELMRETVRETLAGLGFDVKSPIETQADLKFLRDMRLQHRWLRRGAAVAVMTALVGAGLTALWAGVRALVTGR